VDRKSVESSQIASVGYDSAARKLEIEFKGFSGRPTSVYEYENVEQELYDGFFVEKEEDGTKRSVGKYFGRTIKADPKRYPFKRLPPADAPAPAGNAG
jgi:hypothetical protein